jgi:hypothetical protein
MGAGQVAPDSRRKALSYTARPEIEFRISAVSGSIQVHDKPTEGVICVVTPRRKKTPRIGAASFEP